MDDLSGKQLGAYRIVAPIGAGGMATVFKAYQPSMDRYVAVKVLPRQMAADPQFTARFENEARLLARLQHPHILPVFDFGQADGYAFFVMPLVETGTLADRLRGRPLPLKQLCQFIIEIGSALDYAHQRGLLHRDVKPSNILLDEGNNTFLTDFGIAKLLDGSVRFTATGVLVGTPAYMSPEQGRGQSLDRRSDIYSLGVILYELSTGQVPFNAETPVAIVYQHIHDPLPPVEALNPSLPELLVRVIYKALAKPPDERFQTAREMVAAMELATQEAARPLPPPKPQPPTLVEPVTPLPTSASAPPPTPPLPVVVEQPVAASTPDAVETSTPTPAPAAMPAQESALEPARPITPAPPSSTPPPGGTVATANPTVMGGATRRSNVLAMGGVGCLVLVGFLVLAVILSPQLFGGLPGSAFFGGPTATRTAAPTTAPTATRPAPTAAPATAVPTELAATNKKICEVTDAGGLDDRGFNKLVNIGLLDVVQSGTGWAGDVFESAQEADYAVNLDKAWEGGCDLVIAPDFFLGNAVSAAAGAHPSQRFMILDYPNGQFPENVWVQTYAVDQAAFLAGYAAAGASQTGVVGSYGGLNIPSVTDFLSGFVYGVNYFNQVHGTSVQTVGWDPANPSDEWMLGNFDNTDAGRAMAEQLLDQGADIILPAAGPAATGALAAAQARGNSYVIWFDTDGKIYAPEYKDIILTTILKRLDLSVRQGAEALAAGTFTGGEHVGTLEDGNVEMAPFGELAALVPKRVRDELHTVRAGIISGEIVTKP